MNIKEGQVVFHKNLGRVGTFVQHDLHDNEAIVALIDESDGYIDELRVTTSQLILGAKQKANKNNIDDLINEWHESDSQLPLYSYIGLTLKEYKDYVEKDIL